MRSPAPADVRDVNRATALSWGFRGWPVFLLAGCDKSVNFIGETTNGA